MRTAIGNIWTAGATVALAGSAVAAQVSGVTTAIYVGHHFEVRDHEQPTKYVFNGATRVAEVTGSLSANLRVQRLRLYPGWNLCSLAVSGPFPATGADAISAGYQWNAGTNDYSQISPGQTIAAGTVLWVKARTNAVVSVLGAYAEPVTRQVPAGGGYVPATGLEAWSPALPDSESSWDFDASTAQWFEHLAGDLAAVSGSSPSLGPGEAFYLKTDAPADLQIPDPAVRIRYYHEDHLGSSSVVSDSAGAVVEETAFYPFGAPRDEFRPRQVEEPYGFTQKERDRESGLDYFETRYLASGLARFVAPDLRHACPDRLSPEALGDWLSVPQQLNLYAYVRNNPLRYIDPLGEDASKPNDQPEPAVYQTSTTLTLKSGGQEMNIAVSSWRLDLGEQVNVVEEQGGSAKDKQAFQKLVITKEQDKWSGELFRAAHGMQPGPLEGELTMRRTVNGHSEVYMRIKLKTVVIGGVNIGGGGDRGVSPAEEITLKAAEVTFEFPGQKPTEEIPGLKTWAPEPQVLRNRYSKPEPQSAPAPNPASGADLNPFHLMKKLLLHPAD